LDTLSGEFWNNAVKKESDIYLMLTWLLTFGKPKQRKQKYWIW